MRFHEFLKTTVLLSAGASTALAAIAVLSMSRDFQPLVLYVALGWWAIALWFGLRLGARADTSPPIARLLAEARTQTTLPELRPATTLLNRLWPLLVMTLVAGIGGIFVPQIAAVAAGFALIWALAWRHQHLAVLAIEERDAARFYIDRTSPLAPMRLVRTPGFGGRFVTPS